MDSGMGRHLIDGISSNTGISPIFILLLPVPHIHRRKVHLPQQMLSAHKYLYASIRISRFIKKPEVFSECFGFYTLCKHLEVEFCPEDIFRRFGDIDILK